MTEERREIGTWMDLRKPGQWLKAPHFRGAPATFTVSDFYSIPDEKGDPRGILEFRETPLRYMTQKTNEELLRALFGDDPQAVIGQRITLGPAKDLFGNDVVDAIRVVGAPHLPEPLTRIVKFAKKTGRKPAKHTLRPTPEVPSFGAEQAEPQKATAENLTQALRALDGVTSPEAIDAILDGLRCYRWGREWSAQIKEAAAAARIRCGVTPK